MRVSEHRPYAVPPAVPPATRRRAAVLAGLTALTAAGFGGGVLTSAPPAAAAEPIAPIDLSITVTDLGPEERTCTIDADLYLPPVASAAAPVPAILATNGFGGTKADQADYAQSLGRYGYATLSYTGLGFVDGDLCPITLDDREHDGAAASQLLRFLAGDPAVAAIADATGQPYRVDAIVLDDPAGYDPRVGMFGGSYGGQIQFALAGYEAALAEADPTSPERLDAIVPIITWNDLSYSLTPDNAALPGAGSVSADGPGVAKYQWAALFSLLGVGTGLQDLAAVRDPAAAVAAIETGCPNFAPEVCTALLELATAGQPSQATIDFLRERSVSSYLEDISVPTLIAQGQADSLFNLQESVATYTALRDQGTPTQLMWQSWGHSNLTPQAGELDEADLLGSYQGRVIGQWFDYYLRGPDPDLDCPAPSFGFSYFRDYAYTAPDATSAYAVAADYPVGTEVPLHLSGTGGLVSDPAALQPGSSAPFAGGAAVGPNFSELSGPFGPTQPPPLDPPGSAASFLSAPIVGEPVTVVGAPEVTVQLAQPLALPLSSEGLVIYVKLYDLGPDGVPTVLPQRLISPIRVSDLSAPIRIELPGIVHRFEVGHRLSLTFAGGDLAYRGNTVPTPVQVVNDPAAPNTLSLPLVGAERSAASPVLGCTPTPAESPGGTDDGAGVPPEAGGAVVAGAAGPTGRLLAYTSAAYHSIGLLQLGGALLIGGAVVVAAVPPRRRA